MDELEAFACDSCGNNKGNWCSSSVAGYPARQKCTYYSDARNPSSARYDNYSNYQRTNVSVVTVHRPVVVRVVSSTDPKKALKYCKLP